MEKALTELGFRYLPDTAAAYYEAVAGHRPEEAEAGVMEIAATVAAMAYAQGRDGKELGTLFPFLEAVR